jgi:hypothetical protein
MEKRKFLTLLALDLQMGQQRVKQVNSEVCVLYTDNSKMKKLV